MVVGQYQLLFECMYDKFTIHEYLNKDDKILLSSFSVSFFVLQLQVDKALLSIEEEAERIYKDERGLLLDDEAASTRDAM